VTILNPLKLPLPLALVLDFYISPTAERSGWSVTEVANALHMKRSTVDGYLKQLAAAGWLSKGATIYKLTAAGAIAGMAAAWHKTITPLRAKHLKGARYIAAEAAAGTL
jgi:DNA-binding IclR family transcriptional regulator